MEDQCWGISSDGSKNSFKKMKGGYCEPLKEGDDIVLEINMTKGELSYNINGINKGVAFPNIDFKSGHFYLLIDLFGSTSIQILNDKVTFDFEEDPVDFQQGYASLYSKFCQMKMEKDKNEKDSADAAIQHDIEIKNAINEVEITKK